MPCASLKELPPPPDGKTGWPWTIESDGCADETPVSIVTPSFQQAEFLEACIRSVLLQGIPNLELRMMDGGSTDGSVEILQKYDRWIDHWQSEKDGGQGAAINAGLQRASGEVFAWMNSDDLYLAGGIARLLGLRSESPETGVWIGASEVRDAQDTVIKVKKFPGPIGLVPHGAKKDAIFLAASICAGYSKAPNFSSVKADVRSPEGKEVIEVIGIPPEDAKKLMIK